MIIGLSLSICQPQAPAAGSTTPPEWIGQTPLVDWDMASAVLSGSDILSVPNAGTGGSALTGATVKPQFIGVDTNFNGQPSANFPDATGGPNFTFTALGIPTNGPCIIYLVGRRTTAGSDSYALSVGSRIGIVATTTNIWQGWIAANTTILSTNNAPGTSAIVAVSLNSGTERIYVSSATEDVNNASNGVTDGAGKLGTHSSAGDASFCLRGQIARVLVFADAHDAVERAAVMAALGTKYGITIT